MDLRDLEYPRHVHRACRVWWQPGDSLIVRDHHECAVALSEGWSLVPFLNGSEPTVTPPHGEPLTTTTPVPAGSLPNAPPKPRGWPKGKPRKVQP